MEDRSASMELLRRLLESQLFGVVATDEGGQPYSNLVAFAATEDLKTLVFATRRDTRKYTNIVANPRVAILVDSRSNKYEDLSDAMAVTAVGRAVVVSGSSRDRLLNLYIAKHPQLADFVNSPGCELIKVEVEKYYLVTRFQRVTELDVTY